MRYTTTSIRKSKRARLAYQFELLLPALQEQKGYALLARGRSFTFTLQRADTVYRSLVLPRAFDFYTQHISVSHIDLIIVESFDCVVPVWCISLDDREVHEPYARPLVPVRENKRRRNHHERHVLLSRYLLNEKEALAEIAALSPRQRRRYRQWKEELLQPRRGRPLER